MNNQKPEPFAKGDGMSLDVHSIFPTIQGEGPFAGVRSIFVRLAGCNLQCPGCDTEYTEGRQRLPVLQIAQVVKHHAEDMIGERPLIVLTGGEPMRQIVDALISVLISDGFRVQIESNGVFAPSPLLEDWIKLGLITLIVSPKTSRISSEAARLAAAFKYVLDHREVDPSDGLPTRALEHKADGGVARPPASCRKVYVNPRDCGDPELNAFNLRAVVDSCMSYGYIAGVQMHKLMNIE